MNDKAKIVGSGISAALSFGGATAIHMITTIKAPFTLIAGGKTIIIQSIAYKAGIPIALKFAVPALFGIGLVSIVYCLVKVTLNTGTPARSAH